MAKKAYIGVDGKARKIKKGYVGVENFVPRALPAGYTQLSHIEATGAQYFDTKFKPNQNTRVVMDVQMTSSAASQFVFGCRTTSYTENFILLISSANSSFRSGYGGSLVGFSISDLAERYSIDHNKTVCKMSEHSVTHSAQTFQSSLTLYLCAANEGGTAKYFAKMKMWPCLIYDNGTLVRDYVPCKNASGVVGMYDMVNGTFGGSATSTAFVAGDTLKSVARKIRKAYIGIGGVARPCWSGGELAYYGLVPGGLSAVRRNLAATHNGGYAIFAGGTHDTAGEQSIVDAYDESLTGRRITSLSRPRFGLAGAPVGEYALFAGGQYGGTGNATVDAYDKSLTRTTPATLGFSAWNLGGAPVGNYAIFGGGYNSGYNHLVNAYNASLTRTSPALQFGAAQSDVAATTVGGYALFAGSSGANADCATFVNAYDASLTRTIPTALSVVRRGASAATVGNYALVAGSRQGNAVELDVYDSSLVKSTATPLSTERYMLAATSVGDYALFGGGYGGSGDSKVVDVYDASLTRTTNSLGSARSYFAATTVGNCALFGGGYDIDGKHYADVDAFIVA